MPTKLEASVNYIHSSYNCNHNIAKFNFKSLKRL